MAGFAVKELGPRTWPDFARMVEKHNGVWGGCWCVAFHLQRGVIGDTAAERRELKEKLVMADRTHNVLVYDGSEVVGFCQYGPPAEIPARMRGYASLGLGTPDWRIPCFFIDRDWRHRGVAKAALDGALRIIAEKGGGTVDAYPLALGGRPYGSSFLWGGTESMFAKRGFRVVGRLGTSKVLMRKEVRGQPKAAWRRTSGRRRPKKPSGSRS